MTKLVFKNGEELTIPRIYTASGWIYRPDEARTALERQRGINKSFGRTSQGHLARAWLSGWLQDQFDKMGWPELAQIDTHSRYENHRVYPGGMGISYKHPGLGWQTLSIDLARQPDNRDVIDIDLSWVGWNIQSWYDTKTVPEKTLNWRDPITRETIAEIHWQVGTEQAYTETARFAENPIQYANLRFTKEFPVGPIQDELEWPKKPHNNYREYEAAHDIRMVIDQAHIFWMNRQEVEKVFIESKEVFDKLAAAYKHHGITVNITMANDYSGQVNGRWPQYLTEAEFKIPSTQEGDPLEEAQHNMFGHTITFTSRNVDVKCGYVQDQQRWEETQKRNMANWLSEMHDDIEPDNYEEWEYTPNND